MDRLFQEVVASGVVPIILEFLGPVSALTRFSLINKACFDKVLAYIVKFHKGSVTDGVLEELSGDRLQQLWDCARLFPHSLNLAKMSPQARHMISISNDMHFLHLQQFSNDLMYTDGYIFTYWFGSREHPEKGIYHELLEKQQTHPDWYPWKDELIQDGQYWNSSRVYGNFIVLFDRPDGTILVTEDFKQVFLVVGITQPIGLIHHVQLIGTIHYIPLSAYPPPRMHGPYIGTKVRMTLFNWEGKIVYNGVSSPYAIANAKEKTKAIKAYRHALVQSSLVTTLPVHPSGEHVTKTTEEIRVLSHAFRAEMPSKIHKLGQIKTSNMLPEVQFRRFSVDEVTNPKHVMTLLDTETGNCYATYRSRALIPTCEEYVEWLLSFSLSRKQKPLKVSMDAYEVYDVLKDMLLKIGIKVYYEPPFSPEHDMFMESHNPIAISQPFRACCQYCHRTAAMLIHAHDHDAMQARMSKEEEEKGKAYGETETILRIPETNLTHESEPAKKKDDGDKENVEVLGQALHHVTFAEKVDPEREEEGKFHGDETGKVKSWQPKASPAVSTPAPTLSRCSRCQKVFYCCREHQLADWNKHRKLCSQQNIASNH